MKKTLCTLLAAIMFIMSFCCVSFAATDNSWSGDIDSVSLELRYDTFKAKEKYNGNDVDVFCGDGTLYSVASQSLNKSSYHEGDIPVLTVKLAVNDPDSHRFATSASYKANVHVSGGEPTYASTASSGKSLTVRIELNEVDEADDPGWDNPSGGPGTGGGTSQGGPGDIPQDTQGAFLKDPNNGRMWYALPNGTRAIKQWMKINSKWYYFDELGYMCQNSWLKYQEKWYFVGPEGDMWVNRRTPDGYYVDKNGVWDGKPKS